MCIYIRRKLKFTMCYAKSFAKYLGIYLGYLALLFPYENVYILSPMYTAFALLSKLRQS